LWRVKSTLSLPVLQILPDGSYTALLVNPAIRGKARTRLVEDARTGAGTEPDPGQARLVRVIEYQVPDRDGAGGDGGGDGGGELICLITNIVEHGAVPAMALAGAYQQRWEHETGNDQIKTHLRGPARILRSKHPDMVRQEIYGYLLTHYALSALICRAATEAGIDPGRVKFTRTTKIIRRSLTRPADFSP